MLLNYSVRSTVIHPVKNGNVWASAGEVGRRWGGRGWGGEGRERVDLSRPKECKRKLAVVETLESTTCELTGSVW